jgi:hypothetical protein
MKLLGYYPLIFYDQRMNVIPNFSRNPELPPFSISRVNDADKYLQLLGGSINVDNKTHNFEVGPIKVQSDYPVFSKTLALQFDVLSQEDLSKLGEGVRFNLFEVKISETKNQNDQSLASISIGLLFTGTAPSEIPNKINGETQIIINSIINGIPQETHVEVFKTIFGNDNSGDPKIILNQVSSPYPGSCSQCGSYDHLISPQMLLMTVNLLLVGLTL